MSDPLIRDISDTARWMAVYRARESARPNAVFKDPHARSLAGERGEEIAKSIGFGEENDWPFVARTYLLDQVVKTQVAAGVDLILNLAAGLDTRPYRMELPSSLRWVEVDLPAILDYKTRVLASATPACAIERVPLDLSNPDARRGLFARLGRSATRALVLTEGLVIYLMADEVCALGRDLAAQPAFQQWAVDIASPGLLKMMQERMSDRLKEAGTPFLFAPPEGPPFFERCGWKPIDVRSLLKAARRLGRLPLFLRLMAMLPESNGPQGSRPWSAAVLLERKHDA